MMVITRPLVNPDEVAAWARSEGFHDIVPSTWHVTLARRDERSMVLPALDEAPLTIEPALDRVVTRMGEFIVLGFSSLALSARHAALRRMGCRWDFASYRPHLTIAPGDSRDLRGVCAFQGALVFGAETTD